MSKVAIVDVCSGNLRSVERALAAAGAETFVTRDPDELRRADKLVIPGQGALGTFARGLAERGLEPALREQLASGKPMLGICLGLQVLFERGEEQGGVPGLGILAGQVLRFAAAPAAGASGAAGAAAPRGGAERPGGGPLKVPHIGWNQIETPAGQAPDPMLRGLPEGAHVYFVHSYYAAPSDRSIIAAETDYGGKFCSAIRKDNLFACQFHPEKSQRVGQAILRNFVERA
jgi:imidazole glycerol-phosphate synthase subunit HisH